MVLLWFFSNLPTVYPASGMIYSEDSFSQYRFRSVSDISYNGLTQFTVIVKQLPKYYKKSNIKGGHVTWEQQRLRTADFGNGNINNTSFQQN